ncbi:MAG TPA: TonB family protein [Longimicrobium sp.]|nr:TonB family protein [Longimicrobium sp.]
MLIRIIAFAAVLLSAAPADAQQGGPRCRTTANPAGTGVTPGATNEGRGMRRAVLDSVEADIEAAARQAGIQQPAGMVVIVMPDHAAGRAEIHLHESNVRESFVRDALARRAPLLASLPPDGSTLHFWLEPVPFPAADSVVVECRPQMTNLNWFAQELRQAVQEEASDMSGTADLKMLVARDGRVAYAYVQRSGRPALDQALVRVTRRLRFQPATVQGVPVDVWVAVPVPLGRR